MSSPELTALSLVEKYSLIDDCDKHYDATSDGRICKHLAKACAIIAVNLLIKHSKDIAEVYDLTFDESTSYYTKVKNEINKL
jgi:hypothetical protein